MQSIYNFSNEYNKAFLGIENLKIFHLNTAKRISEN